MAYKQETCPLCGRNLTAIETYPGRGEVYCCHCDLTIGGNDAKTPEELIALLDGSEHRRLKAENAKLRELVRKYGEYTSQDRCDGCVCKSRCNNGDVDECWQLTNIRELERELGVPHEKE